VQHILIRLSAVSQHSFAGTSIGWYGRCIAAAGAVLRLTAAGGEAKQEQKRQKGGRGPHYHSPHEFVPP
jgi:hypothetical protein